MMKKTLLILISISYALTTMAQNAPIDLYIGGTNKLNFIYDTPPPQTDGNKAVATEVTTGSPYEGNTHYQFDYISMNYWAGNGGFNINNWGGNTQDFSGHTHMKIAYRGTGTTANSLVFWLTDSTVVSTGPIVYYSGPEVIVATPNANYQVVNIPLSSFVGTGTLDLSNLQILNWKIGVALQITSGQFYIDNIQIVDLSASGIADKYPTVNIFVSPNPSSGIYTISSAEKIDAVTVSDNLGRIISTHSDLQIDLTNHPDGLYFVTVISGEKRAVKKLIKK
jgi:hypothetical protein